MKKPCDTCKRCKDPSDCENKSCQPWRNWWLNRWEKMRSNTLLSFGKKEEK